MRTFKVIDSSNIGFGIDFTGQDLEFLYMSTIPDHVVLKQPEYDANGKPRSGVVTFSLKNVKENVL